MKISLNWLSDYIEIERSADQIAGILSDLGLPCESIKYFGDDAIIDVEVTSNRGDCLSYIGIARELAAATGRVLKAPAVELDESGRDAAEFVSVKIAEPDLCSRYTARIIEQVKVGPSPGWLRKRLETVGMRSVNNVVDATNYVMLETGQPPHAFDYKKIAEGKIIVRKAVAGERIVSIDGTQCDLDTDMLIIADGRGPVAIAGIMGGADTEVSEATTTVLLEDAHFEPVSVRTTSRKLSLPSEAAFRFERTVDIEAIENASRRTASLIAQVAGGKVAKGVIDIYPQKPEKKEVTLRLSRLNKLLGIEVPSEQALKILSALGFYPRLKSEDRSRKSEDRQQTGIEYQASLVRRSSGEGGSIEIVCSVPSWRSDIYREADLVEEVARLYSYDKIPTERKIKIEVVPVDTRHKLSLSIGAYLNSCGFYETINVGFVDGSVAGLFTAEDAGKHLVVRDVSSKSANLLRQTLIGSLLGVLKTNLNAGNLPCRVFEIADTFVPHGPAPPPCQRPVAAGRRPTPTGGAGGALPTEKTKLALVCDSNFRDLRGVVEGLIKSIDRAARTIFTPAELLWAQVGAQVVVNGQTIGTAGIVSQRVREKFDLKQLTPCAAELDFERLFALQSGVVKVRPIPRFPAIKRDLSIIVDEDIRWADIVAAVSKKAPGELEYIRFVGIYRGGTIPTGRKSVTLTLTFRDWDGTLTHDMVDRFQAEIVRGLAESVGAKLRTV